MSAQEHDRKSLALRQLETALRLYFEREDYASVITLAGAADEVFGKLLTSMGRSSSLDEMTKTEAAIHEWLFKTPASTKDFAKRANLARNNLKHWDAGSSLTVRLDLEEEAHDMLGRAIDNYWSLEELLTPAMERFQRESMSA